jgi:hypothetical protein
MKRYLRLLGLSIFAVCAAIVMAALWVHVPNHTVGAKFMLVQALAMIGASLALKGAYIQGDRDGQRRGERYGYARAEEEFRKPKSCSWPPPGAGGMSRQGG